MDVKKKLLVVALFLLGLLGGIFYFANQRTKDEVPSSGSANTQATIIQDTGAKPPDTVRVYETLKSFTPADFKKAYDNLSLPNIIPIITPPEITSNIAADAAIHELAETRGYRLRDVASGLLNEIEQKPVQELLIADWQGLQQMAREEGISIGFVSGYRSIEDQREIFLSRLRAAGITNNQIADRQADDELDSILAITAPPGYSRHHGGYTIDVENPGVSVFAASPAYAWISANNFEKAKLHGFIPSYPEGLERQGPNPEPWEFVWVSKSVTYED